MNTFKIILKWLYGLGFAILGLSSMFSNSFLGGLAFLTGGLILLPPIINFIESKLSKPLTRPVKYSTALILVIIGSFLISNDQVKLDNNVSRGDVEAYNNLPQNVKDSLDKIKIEAEKIENEKRLRKAKIESSFSPWDGSHIGLTSYIKQNMNDPESYEHIDTRYNDNESTLYVVTQFRGKNAFGGKVKNTVRARVDLDGNVIEIISQD